MPRCAQKKVWVRSTLWGWGSVPTATSAVGHRLLGSERGKTDGWSLGRALSLVDAWLAFRALAAPSHQGTAITHFADGNVRSREVS